MLHALLRLHPAALAFYQLLSEGGWLVVLCGGGCDSVARPRSETAEHIGGDALGCVGGFYMGCMFWGWVLRLVFKNATLRVEWSNQLSCFPGMLNSFFSAPPDCETVVRRVRSDMGVYQSCVSYCDMVSYLLSWLPLRPSLDSSEMYLFEQALQNPKTCVPLNEWMDAKLDGRFKQMDAKIDSKLEKFEGRVDARFQKIETMMDQKFGMLDFLKETNQVADAKVVRLEAVIDAQNVQLRDMGEVDVLRKLNQAADAKIAKLESVIDAQNTQLRGMEDVEVLRQTNQALGVKISKLEDVINTQHAQLREMSGVQAVNQFLEAHNAELRKRVDQLEQLLVGKCRVVADAMGP